MHTPCAADVLLELLHLCSGTCEEHKDDCFVIVNAAILTNRAGRVATGRPSLLRNLITAYITITGFVEVNTWTRPRACARSCLRDTLHHS